MLKGIDVSVWQGNIDWSKAAKEIDFAILRAGYGISTKDKKFEQNYAGCQSNNIYKGVYWYSYAKNVSAAKVEANACLAAIKGKQIDFPVWYDIEENSIFATGKNNVSAIAKTFCEIIAAAGYKVGIYSSKSALQTYFTNEVKDKYYVWMANVGKNGAALSSTSYQGKKDIWQYSWKGKVSGISGDVDMDYCYTDFITNQEKEESKPIFNDIKVIYRVYDGVKWSSEISNKDEHAGSDGNTITGITAKASEGELLYRVHLPNGRWLGWINRADINDWNNGIAGIKNRSIDGIQMKYDKNGFVVKYRVSLAGQTSFLPWVIESGDGIDGYAGIFGKPIDKVQIKIEKK